MKIKFNLTSFISIGLLFSSLLMLFSGVVLFIAPEGSISRWIGWEILGLSKKQWEHQHTVFSYVFIVFALIHILKINWQLMYSYFKAEKFRLLYLKELVLIACITVLIFTGTYYNFQPFRWIIDSGTTVSNNIEKRADMPNISNPEKLSLEEFANKVFNITYDSLALKLKSNGYIDFNKDKSVESFCKDNKISPSDIYGELKGK